MLAFTVSGPDVYAVVPGGYGTTVIRVFGSDGAYRDIDTGVTDHGSSRADQIVVANGMIFWHLSDQPQGGPIIRMALDGDASPEIISGDIYMSPLNRLAVSSGYLLWANRDGRLHRLPVSARAR